MTNNNNNTNQLERQVSADSTRAGAAALMALTSPPRDCHAGGSVQKGVAVTARGGPSRRSQQQSRRPASTSVSQYSR